MPRSFPLMPLSFLFALLPLLTLGCRNSNNRYELIEAELRTRERQLREAKSELQYTRQLNQIYQQNLVRPAYSTTGRDGVPSIPIKEISLGSGTGGVNNDSQPGDEALQVVIVPRDEEASSVKVPANVVVEALEIAENGVKTPIGRWDVNSETLRRTWRGGLFATGYYLLLQWDQPPRTERMRVTVRMTSLDGRQYEADKDISVKLLPGVAALPPGNGVPVNGAVAPVGPGPRFVPGPYSGTPTGNGAPIPVPSVYPGTTMIPGPTVVPGPSMPSGSGMPRIPEVFGSEPPMPPAGLNTLPRPTLPVGELPPPGAVLPPPGTVLPPPGTVESRRPTVRVRPAVGMQ